MPLRPYQAEAVAAVAAEWERVRSTLLVLPTGAGKTHTAATIVAQRAAAGRVLWLAHRSELLEQAAATMRGLGLSVELEQGENRAGLMRTSDVVVASVMTMRGSRLARWPRGSFATIVVDEAHHTAATSYLAILAHFSDARVLGLTATPDRSDEIALGEAYDSCAYEYPILTAITEGWLVPIVSQAVDLPDLDLSAMRPRAGDLPAGELDVEIARLVEPICGALVERAGARQSLLFTPGVASAKAAAEVLSSAHVAAASIDGATPEDERRAIIQAFRAGEIQVLANCLVLTEGTDLPMASCVAMARPTRSRSLYTQALGRGLRPLSGVVDGLATAEERRAAIAASAAPDCLVLDYRPRAGDLSLVAPADVLAGRELPPEIRRRLADGEWGERLHDALSRAEREQADAERAEAELRAREREQQRLEREERARRERERQAALRSQPKRDISTPHRTYAIDLLGTDARGQCEALGVEPGRESGPRASDAQVAALRKAGLEVGPQTLSRREASRVLDGLAARRTKGLATIKQARLVAKQLAKHGVVPPRDLGMREASEIIDAIAQNHWRVPADMVSDLRRRWSERVRGAREVV